MGIRLVYGLATKDLSYLDEFYPSRRLAEAAASMRIDYDATIHTPETSLSATSGFCMGHAALLRGELPPELYEALEADGIVTINSARAHALARDKLLSAEFFKLSGISHPNTLAVDPEQCGIPMELPFVLKPRFGKMGRGVILVSTLDEWKQFLQDTRLAMTEYLAQEYIVASRGKDLRFFFASFGAQGKMQAGGWQAYTSHGMAGVSSVVAMRQGPGLTSNAHAGGTMSSFNAALKIRAEAERIFMASGLSYGTIDFLFLDESDTEFTVCEMNSCPGFEELERRSGLDVAKAILYSVMNVENRLQ